MFCNLNASPSAIAPTRQAENSSRASSNLAEWGQAPRGVTPRSRSRTRLLDFHTSFTRRLIEIADVAGARGSGSSPTTTLNAMRLPAIAHDQHGFVADVNAAAEVVFDNDIKIKDRRLFVRDPDARTLLKNAVDRLKELLRLIPWLWSRSSFLERTNYRSSCAFGPSRDDRIRLGRTCAHF
jgi:hypothetical protein